MPSSPQVVTTQVVFDYLIDTAGKAVVGARVVSTLSYAGATDTSPVVNIGPLQQVTTTDNNGYWQLSLIPNPALTPNGTTYTISTPYNVYDISVPNSAGPFQSSAILVNTPSVLSTATTNLTGPITVTGNETVTGNLTVNGTTSLGSTTVGALTTTGAESVSGDLTIQSPGRLVFGATAAKVIPGATSVSLRNNADSADNLLVVDAGNVTVRNNLTVNNNATITGNETVSGQINTPTLIAFSGSAAQISGGSASLSLRNNANNADNVLVTDAGNVTVRGTVTPVTNVYKARAFLNSAFSLPAGVTTKVPIDTITYDPNNNFSTVNHNYTVPFNGYYFITALGTVSLQNNPQNWIIAIFKNTANIANGDQISVRGGTNNDVYAINVADIQLLAVNDVIDIRILNGGAGVNTTPMQTGTTVTYMAIHYMSS